MFKVAANVVVAIRFPLSALLQDGRLIHASGIITGDFFPFVNPANWKPSSCVARNNLASIEASEGLRIWPTVRGSQPLECFNANTIALAWRESVQSPQNVCGQFWPQPWWLQVVPRLVVRDWVQ